MITYKINPGHFVPDWFDAAFKKAAATKAVAQVASDAVAAQKAAAAADDAYSAAPSTQSADIAYDAWKAATSHHDKAMVVVTAIIAAMADVDFTAAVNAVKSVKISWGGDA